jgi:hypothetical protein
MGNIERWVAREARTMTRREVITKAIDGQLSWVAAADIIGASVPLSLNVFDVKPSVCPCCGPGPCRKHPRTRPPSPPTHNFVRNTDSGH